MLSALRVLFIASVVTAPLAAQQSVPLALTHATVIDGTGAPPRRDMTVVIDRGRIVAVQPSSQRLPANAAVRDLSGRYVIPGLIDSHVHLGTQPRPAGIMERILRAAFLGGVTSVRDMGGQYEIVEPLARLSRADSVPVPAITYAAIVAGPGMWLEGERARFFAAGGEIGATPTVRRLLAASDVAPAIASAKRAGASGIKIYNTIEGPLLRAIAAEARRQGLHVWSHFSVDPNLPSAVIDAGAEVVSHADQFVAEALSEAARRGGVAQYRTARQAAYARPDLIASTPIQALIAKMKDRGTILEPTLFVMKPGPDSTGRIDPIHAALFHNAVEFTRAAHRAGVDIAAGTDGIGGSTPNIHVELQLLVDSVGLTPLQAIRAATSVGARALGVGDSVGTIAAGKRADLVVLAADPSADIANTITVVGVMKAGRYFARPQPMPAPPGARPPR